MRAQSYDAAMLIDSAVAAVKGNLGDKAAVQKALEKADFKSVRGNFKFGTNHYPTQNFYMQEVVKEGDGYTQKTIATAVENSRNVHGDEVLDEVAADVANNCNGGQHAAAAICLCDVARDAATSGEGP